MATKGRNNSATTDRPKWGKNPYGRASEDDGAINLAWYAWELNRCAEYDVECMDAGVTSNAHKRQKMLLETLKAVGVDASDLGIDRTQMAVLSHPDEVFEKSEEQLENIVTQLKRLVVSATDRVPDMPGHGIMLGELEKKRALRVIRLCEKAILIQKVCREKNPHWKTIYKLTGLERKYCAMSSDARHLFRWFRPLRVMLYVRRADVPGWDPIMDLAEHIQAAAVKLGYARQVGARGCMIGMPPGHCKTVFGLSFCADEIADNQELNLGVFHHKEDQASDRLEALKDMITPNNRMGHRYWALFPHVNVQRKKNNTSKFYVKRRSGSKDPTVQSHGINEAGEGADMHLQWYDDVVDAKERYEETQRNKTHKKMTGTWMRRLRGDLAFWFITYTPWHLDDAYARLLKSIRYYEGEVPEIIVHLLSVGKGDDKFYPLWDKYGRKALLRAYSEIADDALYSCLYLMNPVAASSRIVSKLCFVLHDIEDEETQRFLATSKMILSVDPTATVKKDSDMCGVVYAAVNELKKQILILEAWEFHAIQMDLAAFLYEFQSMNPVHEILVETIAGFHATADELELGYELEDKVVRLSGKNRPKHVKLRAVAIYFENGKISFRGVEGEDGRVKGLEEHAWMYDQVLKFGAVKGDHVVDALSQLGIQYGACLWDGEEEVGDEIREEAERWKNRDPRKVEHLKRLRRIRELNPENTVARSLAYVGGGDTDEADWWKGS